MKTKEYKVLEDIIKMLKDYGIIIERTPTLLKIRIPNPDKVTYNPLTPVKPKKGFMEFTLHVGYESSYVPRVDVFKVSVPEEDLLG